MNELLIKHRLEQLGAALREVAPLLVRYHESLIQEGLTPEQALEVVKDLQHILLDRLGDDTLE